MQREAVMKWFGNLSMAKKFVFLSVLVIGCFLVAWGLSTWWMKQLGENFKQFVDKD